ncbi:MAG: hypothetical protein V4671_27360 [Armatimonadota bacterium]
MALAGLVGLNAMSNQMRPKSDHEIEAEQREQAKAAEPSPTASVAPAQSAEPSGGALSDPNSLVVSGQGSTIGAPEAKQEVVVGFSWTPEVQADPSKVSKAADALQKALGSQVRIKVVNVDANQEVPEGVSVGGRVIVPAQSDGVIDPNAADAVKKALPPAP